MTKPSVSGFTYRDRQKIKADDGLFQFCDVVIQRRNKPALSLIENDMLLNVGQISIEFEDRFSEFTVGSVSIKVSNFNNELDLGNSDSYFSGLSKDEIVSVNIYLKMDKYYPIFRGILSFNESSFNINEDEGTLYAEGEIKKYSNITAQEMWGLSDKHRFKHVSDVVAKCLEKMEVGIGQPIVSVLEEPKLTCEDYTFSYYDKTDPDEPVKSVAVDEDGIIYQLTRNTLYSFNPRTREKRVLNSFPASNKELRYSNLIYQDGWLYYFSQNFVSLVLRYDRILKTKKDGSEHKQVCWTILPKIHKEIESSQFSYGFGTADVSYRFYAYQFIGRYFSRTSGRKGSGSIKIDKYMYVDFAYIEGDSIPFEVWPGGMIATFPTTEQKVRVLRNFYKTYKDPEHGSKEVLIQQFVGFLPMYLPPGEYSFISYPSSVDFITKVDKVTHFEYHPDWIANEVPRKFKIVLKEIPDYFFVPCNGFLISPQAKTFTNPEIDLFVVDPTSAETHTISLTKKCTNENIALYVEGTHLFVAYVSEDSCILEEMVIDRPYNCTKVKTETLLDDAKIGVKEISRIDSQGVAIYEYKNLPNFLETPHNIDGAVAPIFIDPNAESTAPAEPPCHAYISNFDVSPFIWGFPGFDFCEPSDSWWLFIALDGDFREEKSQFNKVDYFSEDDFILLVPPTETNIYKFESSPIIEIAHDITQNIWLISRTRIKIPQIPDPKYGLNAKIYKSAGMLPPLRFVMTPNGNRYNYTLVEKEEQTVEAYTLREKAEPVKLTNKYALIDASFKITLENGQEIPSSDYEIQQNKGTDYDEMWIYFGPAYFGKKILITYNYVDPEKRFSGLVKAHDKIYFVETSSDGAKLISYDGTQFKEEGLTYVEQMPDRTYKTLTEVIKPRETGINSNLVHCSKNDRIYGITSPNDFVLFQFAKNISPYIEDVYFQDQNVVQILNECAKAVGFIICMDFEGKFYFVSRNYFSKIYPETLDEDSILDLKTRQASYEFGDRYDKIIITYPGGQETIGEGRLKYTIGSSVISSRGWGRTLAKFSYDYLSKDKQTYIVKTKAFYDLWLLNGINIVFPEKSIFKMTKVHSMTLSPDDLSLEITAREVIEV